MPNHKLAGQVGMKKRPWVGIMPHNNAYAIGASPESALVVIGQPLLNHLNNEEVDAIIGHELGHIINNDMSRMGFARSFQNSLVWYLGFSNTLQRSARWLLTWLSELLVLRLSRKREYWADAIGAALTSKEIMISALEKLHEDPKLSKFEHKHARVMLRGAAGRGSILSTHPTLEQRRSALQKETYLRRVPDFRPKAVDVLPDSPELPLVNDIAYAKGG